MHHIIVNNLLDGVKNVWRASGEMLVEKNVFLAAKMAAIKITVNVQHVTLVSGAADAIMLAV